MTAFKISNIVKSQPDDRDYQYQPIPDKFIKQSVDLRTFDWGIENQGRIGSCSGNSTVSACELFYGRAGLKVELSRLFNYYLARQEEGRIGREGVESLRSNLKCAAKYGIPPESVWPYIESQVDVQPSRAAFDSAATSKLMRYERIDLSDVGDGFWKAARRIRSALSEGYPVVIAMRLGRKFMSIRGPLSEQNYSPLMVGDPANDLIGGHAMTIVGYMDGDFAPFIAENSWGKEWGDNGYFALAQSVLTDVFEAWVVKGFSGYDCERRSGVIRNADVASAYINLLVSAKNVQAVIDACVAHDFNADDLETLMDWPKGSVSEFRKQNPQYNWGNFAS